jgi:hypothetical protein
MTLKGGGPTKTGALMKRKWLTIPEAAQHLALTFGAATEADVLRFCLDGQLKLSVRFVNLAQAKRYVDPAPAFSEAYEEFCAVEAARAVGLPDPVIERRAPTPLEEECSRVVTLREDVYDLPLVGGERLDVEREYQKQTGGPEVTLTAFEGTFVDSEVGIRFQLQKETQASNTSSDGLPYYLEPNVAPHRPTSHYDPASGLPVGSVLVVRTAALQDFETRSLGSTEPSSDPIERPLGQRERANLLAIIAALAEHAGIDVSKPSKAGLTIENLTIAKGARVAGRTVEDYLKRIPDALERKGKTSA